MPTIFNPLEKGGNITEQSDILHVALFGTSFVTGYNMADILKDFAETDGQKMEISSMCYNTQGITGSLSLREIFKISNNSFVDANGNATTDYTKLVIGNSLSYSDTYRYWISNTSEPIDKLYIFVNREILYTGGGANAQLEPIAAKAFAHKLLQAHPNMEIVFIATPAYNENDVRIPSWYATPSVMATAMNNAATMLANGVKNEMPSALNVTL